MYIHVCALVLGEEDAKTENDNTNYCYPKSCEKDSLGVGGEEGEGDREGEEE